ncbi:MAG: metallophosphoesterase family protein [bacterium]|nr:metallophosphoesterase family protein [bacterium]
MKILLLSDSHSDHWVLNSLKSLLDKEEFDLAIIPGDITNRGLDAIKYIQKFADIFEDKKLNWLAVHGNNDPDEVIDFLKSERRDLHFYPREIGNYKFLGIGGWGDELPPYELRFDQNTVLVTHFPPPAISSKKQFNPACQPLIQISGHHHRWQKVQDIGSTRLINIPGSKDEHKAGILTLPQRQVSFFTLPKPNFLTTTSFIY